MTDKGTDRLIILAAAAFIAGVVAFLFRYEVTASMGTIVRLDRWTGATVVCERGHDTTGDWTWVVSGTNQHCPF